MGLSSYALWYIRDNETSQKIDPLDATCRGINVFATAES